MKIIQLSNAALTSLIDHLTDFKGDDIITGGDYNLVLDLDRDKTGGLAKTHKNSVKIVYEFSEKLDLVDVWRILHPDTSSRDNVIQGYDVDYSISF